MKTIDQFSGCSLYVFHFSNETSPVLRPIFFIHNNGLNIEVLLYSVEYNIYGKSKKIYYMYAV